MMGGLSLQRYILTSLKWMKGIKKNILPSALYHEVPPTVQVEPTNFCNLGCICCSAPKGIRKKGYMEYSLSRKIVDDAEKLGVKKVDLFLHGEPFIHPEIIEMLDYFRTKRLKVELATNCMLMDEQKTKDIFSLGLTENFTIRFSMLGFSKEIHEKIQRGVNHETVLSNVNYFLKLKKKLGRAYPKTKMQFYVIPENAHEKKQFMEYWHGKVDYLCINSASIKFRYHRNISDNLKQRRTYCWDFWNRMTIFWNGDVSMCCVDVDGNYIVGNLEQSSIKAIWNGNQMHKLRKLHRASKFEDLQLCKNCDF